MRDFIPEDEAGGSTGQGGFRDFIPEPEPKIVLEAEIVEEVEKTEKKSKGGGKKK